MSNHVCSCIFIYPYRNLKYFTVKMNDTNVAECCRTCLRIDNTLISTSNQDSDSLKYSDKLTSCVSEISWLKEGYPSLICSQCIDRLRIAYDFRLVCLQSDHTLSKYLGHISHDKEPKEICIVERPLNTPTKFEFEITTDTNEHSSVTITEEHQNAEYLHLKHFLDSNDEQAEQLIEVNRSRSNTPDNQTPCTEFITTDLEIPSQETLHNNEEQINLNEHTLLPTHESIISYQQNGQNCSQKISIEMSSTETQAHLVQDIKDIPVIVQTIDSLQTPPIPKEITPPLQVKQIIKRSTGVQVRPISTLEEDVKSSKDFTCTECGKIYCKRANLKIHLRTHTGEKPFECKYCDKRFYHSSHLREHIRRHTGEKPYQCAICNKRFTIKGELTMHIKSHTGEKPYACTCCDRRCLTAADLKVHMRTHTGEKPYTCETCGKKFASSYILTSHIKTHTGERPYACKECDKTFTQSSHLNVHMRKHTGEKVACKICDAKFTHSSQLTVHMRDHTGKQPYKCNVCNKVCNYASELHTHMMRHTGEKFVCVTCDKKFTSLAYLNEHNRTHTGENLSTCKICDRQFTRHQYLEKHMRTHTGEKPYSCFICNKKFTQSSSLKVHMRIHTGEKPYACSTCDKRFTTSSDLTVHMKRHKKAYISL